MADLWNLQSNLNRGELDPLLSGRTDLQTYYNGVETAANVLCIPQGGMRKRPGTEYLDNADLGDTRIENFSFNTEQNYVLAFSEQKMTVYKDGVRQTNINGSGNDYLVIPHTFSQVAVFDYIQTADTAILIHPAVETRVITRTSDTAWSIATVGFTNIPQYDFKDLSSPSPVSEVQTLTYANANEGDRYKIALNGLLTDELVFAGDDATNQENIRIALQDLYNTANSGISVSTDTSLTVYRVTFADDSADAWDLMTGAAVYTLNAAFQITAARILPAGSSRKEDSWSATRGWPSYGTFHEGRLWLGNSPQRPSAIWGSRAYDFFNFDTGKGLDDEAIDVTIDTDQINAITALFSNRSLQIFTTGGEFYIPESPITPGNVAVSPQSNFGVKAVRPVTIDGATLIIQRTGKALLQYIYLDEYQANQTRNISVVASHLIKDPIEMAVSRGTSSTDANYVYILNDDGTLTVLNSLSAEDVQGFTQWVTAEDSTYDGDIQSICVCDDTLYMIVKRYIDGSYVYYLERENTDFYTDSTVTDTTNDAYITGLDHLEGETVWAKADGSFMGEFTVDSGSITLDRTSTDKEAGLAYIPQITTMPMNVQLQKGPNAAAKKKVARVALRLYESNGVLVNDQRLADKTIGSDQFDAPSPRTGLYRISILGWSIEAQITITQSTPMPMTVLSIGAEIAV